MTDPIVCLPSLGEHCGDCHRCRPPRLPRQPMPVLDTGTPPLSPAEDVPCDHERTVEETRCLDCDRTVEVTDAVTVDDLADVPIWRHHPSPDECEHPVTITRRLDIVTAAGDVVGHTTNPVTACLTCHHLTAQEDHP